MSSFANIITQVVTGAFTGYITNTYAVNMLFKEYKISSRIKVGGVIINTKDEFIEKISHLVEQDIINHKTLGRELHKKEFAQSINNFVEDFYKNTLLVQVQNKKISDLKSGRESIEETKKYIKKVIEENIEEAVKKTTETLTVEDILSPLQQNIIFSRLIDTAVEEIKKNHLIQDFTQEFINKNGDKTLQDFLPQEELGKIYQEIPSLISEIAKEIDIDKIIRNFQYRINKKKIGDIILPQAQGNTFGELKNKIKDVLDSPEALVIFTSLSREIINALKKTDKPILDLLSPEFRETTEKFLEANLPHFTGKIAIWIKENSRSIERLIQEGINETVEGVEGMRGVLLGIIKETVLADAASKNRAAEKIIGYLENKIALKEISTELTREVLRFLQRKKISHIIKKLEREESISEAFIAIQIKKAVFFILDSIDSEKTEKIFQKSLGEVYSLDLQKIFSSNQGIDQVVKAASFQIISQIEETTKNQISKIIREDQISNYSLAIEDMINKENLNLPSMDFPANLNLQEKIKTITPFLETYTDQNLKDAELAFYLNKLNENTEIHKKSAQEILHQLQTNLPDLLQGKIENMVAENLNRLTPQEVNEVVHDFMGRELSPITRFGAVLGGIAGMILALTGGGASLTSLEISLPSLLIYGFVGVLTNIIALEMIFRPYKEKKLLNKIGLSSFSQGYIMKNKKTFGQNMGKFVEESLLERRMLRSRFSDLKAELVHFLMQEISKEEFVLIEKAIDKNKAKIASTLAESTLDFLKNPEVQKKTADYMADKIVTLNNGDLFDSNSDLIASQLSEKGSEMINSFLAPARITPIINKAAQYFIELLNLKLNNPEVIRNILLTQENQKKFSNFAENPLSRWMDEKTGDEVAKSLSAQIETKFLSPEGIAEITIFFNQKIQVPMSPNHTLATVFNGRLKSWLEENLPHLLRKAEEYVYLTIERNKYEIIRKTQKSIYDNLGLFQKGGYSMMGGDELVAETIEHIITAKVPPFLRSSRKEIEKIFRNILAENIYTIKLKDIQLTFKEKELSNLLEDLLSNEETRKNILDLTYQGSLEIINAFAKLPIKKVLEAGNLTELADIFEVFKGEIKILGQDAGEEMKCWEKETSQKIGHHLSPGVSELLMKTPGKEKIIQKFILSIYKSAIQKETPGKFISRDILADDLGKTMNKAVNSSETREYLHSFFLGLISDLKENRISIILPETKRDILDQIIQAGLDSLEKNLPAILSSIDFKEITEREIEKMEGREIHNLFKSFAGKYFNSLKLWGALGAGFGIHGGISLLATLTYLIRRGEKNEEKN